MPVFDFERDGMPHLVVVEDVSLIVPPGPEERGAVETNVVRIAVALTACSPARLGPLPPGTGEGSVAPHRSQGPSARWSSLPEPIVSHQGAESDVRMLPTRDRRVRLRGRRRGGRSTAK